MTAGADGLGHMMAVAYRTLDTPAMYVAIIAVSAAGLALDRAFLLVRDTIPSCRTTNARPRP
jgi:ABC-type nitrate/sulfonate/bicarbonate transport system permease component